MEARLNFFFGRHPVGVFDLPAYPTVPGVYAYEPYRGQGHAEMAGTLSDGDAAKCWFCDEGRRYNFVIVAEVYPAGPDGGWAVEVSSVAQTDEPPPAECHAPRMDKAVLNEAMELAMAWGPDWMSPTQARLKAKYPRMGEGVLNEYDTAARAAMNFGHAYVYDHPACTEEECAVAVRAEHPWVSNKNVRHVYHQGIYYARKDQGP